MEIETYRTSVGAFQKVCCDLSFPLLEGNQDGDKLTNCASSSVFMILLSETPPEAQPCTE